MPTASRLTSALVVTVAIGLDLVVWNGDAATLGGARVPVWLPVVSIVVGHQSLWLRHRRPGAVLIAQTCVALVSLAVPLWQPFAGMLAAVSAAARRGLPHSVCASAIGMVAGSHAWGVARSASAPIASLLALIVLWSLLLGAAYVTGRRHRVAAEQAAADRQRADQARDEALSAERLRIARELHDGVTGTVTGLLLQAAGARAVAGPALPGPATASLAALEEHAGRTLDELRRIVDQLRPDQRSDASVDAGADPLARLPHAVQAARAIGLQVQVQQVGEPVPLLPSTASAVLRTVQEGLTNAVKHAGPAARCLVELRWQPGQLETVITTSPRACPPAGSRGASGAQPSAAGHRWPLQHPSRLLPPSASGRFGLRSLTDRAQAAGGQLEHGTDREGHHLRLRVPTAAAEALA